MSNNAEFESLRLTLNAALAQVERLASGTTIGTTTTTTTTSLSSSSSIGGTSELSMQVPAWLTQVDLSNHGAQFTMSDASLRAFLQHVTHLSLRHNQLASLNVVAAALLRPAILLSLDVSHNALISLEFANLLPNLKSLRAHHNPSLVSLSSLALAQLQYLHVSHCSIAGLLSASFCAACTALRALDLSFNALDALPAAGIQALAQLEFLDLRSNRLVDLPSSLELCTALVSLNLANNSLRALPRAIGTYAQLHRRGVRVLLAELPFLQSLVIDGNPLPAAPSTAAAVSALTSSASSDRAATDVASLLRANSPDSIVADAAVAAVVAAVDAPAPGGAPLPTKSASLGDATLKRKVELDPRSAFLQSLDFEVEPFSTIYSEPSKPIIEELSTDTYDYIQFYFGKDHFNYYGVDGKIGPVVVSIRKDLESAVAICGDVDTTPVPPGGIGYYRALVRTKKGVERFFIPNTLVDPSLIEDAVPAAGSTPSAAGASGGGGGAGGANSNANSSSASSTAPVGEALSRPKSGKNVLATKNDSADTNASGLLRGGKKLRGAMLTRALQDLASPLLNDTTLLKVNKSDVLKRLVEYENSLIMSGYKFGVVYAAPGQTTEAEILSNTKGSPAFDEFLAFLGNRITLKGFKKYAGGLDIKSGSTGENAVYTKHAGLEFLFHVSTMLPYKEGDEQQLERKRHIGNDVVVIVFQEGDARLKPDFIRSVFNHIIVIVRPVKLNEQQLAAGKPQPAVLPGYTHEPAQNDALLYAEEQHSKSMREQREAIRVRRALSTELRTSAAEGSPEESPAATPREGASAAAAVDAVATATPATSAASTVSADGTPLATVDKGASKKRRKHSVRARQQDTKVYYEVHVASKLGVGLHRPHLPNPSIFEKGPYFREFLLTKLINTERSAYKAPGFRTAIERTRKMMLEDLIQALK
jgi:Leucine-rich repeat (LRR) protein